MKALTPEVDLPEDCGHQTRSSRPSTVMWAGIAGSAALLVVLFARGWGSDAWGLAAAVLLLVCIGVCVWTVALGTRSGRAIDAAVAQLVEARRQTQSPPTSATRPQGHTELAEERGWINEREVRRAVARIAAARQEEQHRRAPENGTTGG